MNVELLVVPGCPHELATVTVLRQALQEAGLDHVSVNRVEILDPEQADDLGFTGSPTIRIDGKDPFPVGGPTALACRMYAHPDGMSGVPDRATLQAALTRAAASPAADRPADGRPSHRLTLRHGYALAILITGLGAGIGGVVMTLALHVIQHISFGYTEDTFLRGVEKASPLRRVLALAIGGAVTGTAWYVQRRHEGLQISVERALAEGAGLPFGPTVFDAGIQIVAVGAGASIGREGAPRQFGAASGAWISDHLSLDSRQRRTLVAAGAGAGLAAVYNVPFGGAAFAVEILLASWAIADLIPAVVVSWIATVVAWPVLGRHATYHVPHLPLTGALLVGALVLGPLAGAVATVFRSTMKRMTRSVPHGWHEVPVMIAGFAAVGAVAIPYPQVLGNGKSASQVAFDGALGVAAAAALIAIKPLATALCLRVGARGGLLTPAFATGAVLGVTVGHFWAHLWPGSPPLAYAIVGAAAVLASTQRAPLTAFLLTIEFTHASPDVYLPVLLAVALSLGTSSALTRRIAISSETISTPKL